MTRRLRIILPKTGGRDRTGKMVVRHIGGRHKRYLRVIDFRRDKRDVRGRIAAFEYDPNRNVEIALVHYVDGEKRYILRPLELRLSDEVVSSESAEIKPGNAISLAKIPIGTFIHNIELFPGKGGQIVRSAGTAASVMAHEDGFTHIKLPSGEVRKVNTKGFATIGQLGNVDRKNVKLGKAGRSRHMGIKPSVRGVAMDPRSHPHGGGEGRSGIGMSTPKTYYGRPAVGKTRKKGKYSDKYILSRRKK